MATMHEQPSHYFRVLGFHISGFELIIFISLIALWIAILVWCTKYTGGVCTVKKAVQRSTRMPGCCLYFRSSISIICLSSFASPHHGHNASAPYGSMCLGALQTHLGWWSSIQNHNNFRQRLPPTIVVYEVFELNTITTTTSATMPPMPQCL